MGRAGAVRRSRLKKGHALGKRASPDNRLLDSQGNDCIALYVPLEAQARRGIERSHHGLRRVNDVVRKADQLSEPLARPGCNGDT